MQSAKINVFKIKNNERTLDMIPNESADMGTNIYVSGRMKESA